MGLFQHGVFFTISILAVGFIGAVIAIEKYLVLRYRFQIESRKFFVEFIKKIQAKDYFGAGEFCAKYPGVPLAQILGAGAAHANKSIEAVDLAMESQTLYFIPKVNERVNHLSSLANVATLLGLVGTITGLITSFNALGGGSVEGLTRSEALAAGISQSMIATALGLIVAIPTVLAHLFLAAKATKLVEEIDHYAMELKRVLYITQLNAEIKVTTERKEQTVETLTLPGANPIEVAARITSLSISSMQRISRIQPKETFNADEAIDLDATQIDVAAIKQIARDGKKA